VGERIRGFFGSIRIRLTLVALVIVGLVLGGAGIGLVVWQQQALVVDQRNRVFAVSDAAALALAQHRSVLGAAKPGTGVQVVDSTGRVVMATEALAELPPVSAIQPPVGRHQIVPLAVGSLKGDDGVDVIAASTVGTSTGRATVYAVAYGSQLDRSRRSLIVGLGIILPLIMVVTGLLAWMLTGLALRPVERMRAKVADLAQDRLDERVEVPSGNDEIGRLAMTLNEMLERLEDAQQRQRSFVSDASHELRSPIASLLATVEVARSHPDRADWPRVAEVVTAEGQRLSRLVDDLLSLAAGDEHPQVVQTVPVDLDELLLAEASRLRLQGGPTVRTAKIAAVRVMGDPDMLARAIRNLIDNAVRHCSSEVSLSVVSDGDRGVVTIADDGPGVDPGVAERLFERFTRSEESRERAAGGAGLGLAIVAAVARAHRGSVRFVSAERGAIVEFSLPIEPIDG
jgi:signal transduction histidine kinase